MKKIAGIVLGTMMLALLATGCKRQEPAPETIPSEATEAAPDAVPAETPTAQ